MLDSLAVRGGCNVHNVHVGLDDWNACGVRDDDAVFDNLGGWDVHDDIDD
jgi:hypothetical protein